MGGSIYQQTPAQTLVRVGWYSACRLCPVVRAQGERVLRGTFTGLLIRRTTALYPLDS